MIYQFRNGGYQMDQGRTVQRAIVSFGKHAGASFDYSEVSSHLQKFVSRREWTRVRSSRKSITCSIASPQATLALRGGATSVRLSAKLRKTKLAAIKLSPYLWATPFSGNFPLMKSSEIRESRKAAILGTLAGWLMKVWSFTLRVEIEDRCGISRPDAHLAPVVYALWHSRIFTIPPIWAIACGKSRRSVVLTSASHDGALLARAMGVFGIGAVRGSSSRRAVAGLIGMKRALLEGFDVCITPDGPRGPRYALHPGVVKLAETAQAPILPIHVTYSSAWRLKTWDRLVIPKPFSRVLVVFDELHHIPAKLDGPAFQEKLLTLQAILRQGTDDA
jgi:lysophospholipid acyltransferase (LPLAT)-like uncharacterized protein